MVVLQHLWIIPLLPLLGAAVNGLFGGRWPHSAVNAVASEADSARHSIERKGANFSLGVFADVGVQIPIFNRNQGGIATSKAEVERAEREVQRVKLALRERAATVVQNYAYSQTAAARYKTQMIPRAQKAYEMYAKKYREMAAAYPQVLIAQRTLMQLQIAYLNSLETFEANSVALQSYLLTDGLEAPSQPGEIDRPIREMNVPFQPSASSRER